MNPIRFVFIGALIFTTTIGCNGKKRPADLPRLNPVSVKLTQEDVPLAGAAVTLIQQDGAAKWAATGETNADGIATGFFTNGMYEGVAEGRFKVCVVKTLRVEEDGEIPPEPTDPGERYLWEQKYILTGRPAKLYNLVEGKYETPEKSGLEIEVKRGKNEFSFDLGKAVRTLDKR